MSSLLISHLFSSSYVLVIVIVILVIVIEVNHHSQHCCSLTTSSKISFPIKLVFFRNYFKKSIKPLKIFTKTLLVPFKFPFKCINSQ